LGFPPSVLARQAAAGRFAVEVGRLETGSLGECWPVAAWLASAAFVACAEAAGAFVGRLPFVVVGKPVPRSVRPSLGSFRTVAGFGCSLVGRLA